MRQIELQYRALTGVEALPFLNEIAQLRMKVFCEWPYLYKGELNYEKKYLQKYFKSRHSIIVLAFHKKEVVGASTAIWLPDAEKDFHKPFLRQGLRIQNICYFGESVLLKKYRGLGAGKIFMKLREQFAQQIPGVSMVGFCAVIRPSHHQLRPKRYKSLEPFWQKLGFRKNQKLTVNFSWLDVGQKYQTEKKLCFWLKALKQEKFVGWSLRPEHVIRSYYQAFNQRHFTQMLKLIDKNIKHEINAGTTEVGKEKFSKFLSVMDVHYRETVEELEIFKGKNSNRWAAEFFISGIYKKSQKGLPIARGQYYRVRVGAFFELTNNKITRVTNYYNLQEWINKVR